jgi:hypothetical protein
MKKDTIRKELRVVLTPDAYARVVAQALRLDQTPSSFARQIVMERVVALEALQGAGSQTGISSQVNEFVSMMKDEVRKMEEQRK